MRLDPRLRMGAGILLMSLPVAAHAADGHPGGGATTMEVEPGFPPSDSQDNAPPPEFSRSGDGRGDSGGAAAGEPDAVAPPGDDEDAGMPPTDSEDAVPPAAPPAGTEGGR